MARSGAARGTAPARAGMPLVLMYHSVIPYHHDPYLVTVSPARFAQQMAWLHRHGRRGVAVRELLAARAAGRDRGLVGLTFDDGYADFLDQVLPVLRRHSFTATVFVIAGRLGGDNEWDPEGPRKPLMTADQVATAAAANMEIGSHGMRHVDLRPADDVTLEAEIVRSRAILREISGQDVPGFCYPYGHLSGPVVDRVRGAGYAYGCAIWRSPQLGTHALPRTYIGDADTAVRLRAKWLRHQLRYRQRRS